MRVFLILFFLSLLIQIDAQDNHSHCQATEIHEATYAIDADYRHMHDTRMAELDQYMEIARTSGRLDCPAPILIPVAVHYEGVTSQTLSCLTNLALSQIEAMNRDFSASNADIANFDLIVQQTELEESQLAAEGACIQFCLADTDHPPGFGLNDGDLAITINQNYVADNNFPNFTNGTWAGYLNIFVTEGTGVLGYSPLFGNANGSGVVIEACAFGIGGNNCGNGIGSGGSCIYPDYNLGRVCVHEAGHYLGLNHLWGPGNQGTESCNADDGFSDTPNSDVVYFNSPAIGSASCGSDDMYMNYMDYPDDAFKFMFSEQQANLMYQSASSIWGTNSTKCSSSITLNDASITNIIFPLNQACGSTVTPVVRLRNAGGNALTSVDIVYSAGVTGSNTYNWTGNLGQDELEVITLPAINSPSEDYTLMVASSNPNGVADENPSNDTALENLTVLDGVTLPFTEDVENFSVPFPAQGIIIDNVDNDNYTWDRRPGASAYGNGVYSIFFDNFNATNGIGKEDWFIFPEMNVANFNSVDIAFDMAYTYFSDGGEIREDDLKIMYSLSCTDVWVEGWMDGGASLATANPTNTMYLPNPNTDWQNKVVSLNTDDNDFIRIAFVNVSGRGNSLFLDNINITGSTAVVSNTDIESLSNFKISPNPSKGFLNMDIQFDQTTTFDIRIHDAVGREVYTVRQQDISFQNQLDMTHLSNGIYFVSLVADNKVATQKFILAQ